MCHFLERKVMEDVFSFLVFPQGGTDEISFEKFLENSGFSVSYLLYQLQLPRESAGGIP